MISWLVFVRRSNMRLPSAICWPQGLKDEMFDYYLAIFAVGYYRYLSHVGTV